MSQQTVLRFFILLRESFSDSIVLAVIRKYDQGAIVHFSTVFGPVYLVPCQNVL